MFDYICHHTFILRNKKKKERKKIQSQENKINNKNNSMKHYFLYENKIYLKVQCNDLTEASSHIFVSTITWNFHNMLMTEIIQMGQNKIHRCVFFPIATPWKFLKIEM